MKKHYFLTLLLLIPIISFGQDILYQESFETDGNGTRYTLSNEFTDGDQDFFTRTDGSNISGAIELEGQDQDFWFGGMDLNGEGDSETQTLSFTVDISDYQNLNFSILLAEDDATDGAEDWDADDSVIITYTIDGGIAQNLLAVESGVPPGEPNGRPRIDANFDGRGEGTIITDTFAEFSVPIPQTGSSIEITITATLDAGDEDIAIDLITLEGDAIVLSTAQTEIEGFNLYPNPVTDGRLNITTTKNLIKHITVFDVLGKRVLNKIFTGNTLDVSPLTPGIYMLKVTEDSKTVIRKLVVR